MPRPRRLPQLLRHRHVQGRDRCARPRRCSCPLDRLLAETDSPYLAPVPHRGRRNQPACVPVVGARLADVRGVATGRWCASSPRCATARRCVPARRPLAFSSARGPAPESDPPGPGRDATDARRRTTADGSPSPPRSRVVALPGVLARQPRRPTHRRGRNVAAVGAPVADGDDRRRRPRRVDPMGDREAPIFLDGRRRHRRPTASIDARHRRRRPAHEQATSPRPTGARRRAAPSLHRSRSRPSGSRRHGDVNTRQRPDRRALQRPRYGRDGRRRAPIVDRRHATCLSRDRPTSPTRRSRSRVPW